MSIRTPIIGLTNSDFDENAADLYAASKHAYAFSLVGAKGIPLPLTTDEETLKKYAEKCDGILFTGGEDVEPCRYGAEDDTGNIVLNRERDEFELKLFEIFHKTGKPVFGICRGIQLINVALGGTLYRDLPKQCPSDIKHAGVDKKIAAHSIKTEPSPLRDILGADKIPVNSNHHQAVLDCAPCVKVAALSDDGIIESIYEPDYPSLLLALQWHPECMLDENSIKIYRAFSDACRKNVKTEMKKLSIDLSSAEEFSPYVFGHNLEHTRGTIFKGLSAQLLRNRKFAGRPFRSVGVATEWYPIGEKTLFINEGFGYTKHLCHFSMERRNEQQSQVMQNIVEGQKCGIGQHGINITAGTVYEFIIVTNCVKETVMKLEFTDRYGGCIYAEKDFTIPAGEWLPNFVEIVSDASDPDGDVRITFTDRVEIMAGSVSLLPKENFHGMRPDVVALLKEIAPTILRWPGGCFSGEYRWEDGLLPEYERAPLCSCRPEETQPYTYGYDFHDINTDDFIALCREVGAEPFITVNPAWGTPEESAEWVEYCNGSVNTEYGKKRAELGHPEPYNVKYWSLGNEFGYPEAEGPMDPEGYAGLVRKHAEAMLAKTPDLKLSSSGLNPNDNWSEKSAAALSDVAKYVALHNYVGVRFDYTSEDSIKKTYNTAVDSAKIMVNLAYNMRNSLDKYDKSLLISFDEWNIWAAWFRAVSVAEGMFTACVLHFMIKDSNALAMPVCCYFEPVGEGCIEINPDESHLTADGQIFSLMKTHCNGKICKVNGDDGYDVIATVKNNVISVTLLNTSYDEETEISIADCGRVMFSELYTSDDLTAHSVFEKKELSVRAGNGEIRTVLPPHSVALIKIAVK